ncbi:nuclear transport factor 2 family protein [Brachybacterium hainanense]|uniref:Nuclear transport factor 2 family protein n=1 Tax=Brachybacterium hainanense TaxID=1541174 RepID=A0ABV6RD21_9MICO
MTSTPSIPEPVASFLAAVTAHDPRAFDLFTDTPVVDDWGRELMGLEQISRWSDTEFIGSSPTLTVTAVTVSGPSVTVVGDWRSTHANGPSSFRFDLDGDRIARMTIREG